MDNKIRITNKGISLMEKYAKNKPDCCEYFNKKCALCCTGFYYELCDKYKEIKNNG